MGLSTADVSNICKSPLGMMGQAFGGKTVQQNCASYNILTTIAILLGIFGIVLIIIGFIKKNDFSPKTKITIFTLTMSIVTFLVFLIILSFPYGLVGSIITPIIIVMLAKRKITHIS